jgi:two-component system, OmpR family, phosphate regulon sensor histidine kinase PhoR
MARKQSKGIPWFILAMVFAFLGMSTIQIHWLRSSVRMKQQLFDDNVAHALSEVQLFLTQPSTAALQAALEAVESDPGTPSIGKALSGAERAMLQRMDAFMVDSLIREALRAHGVAADPVIGVFDRFGQPVRLEESDEPHRTALTEEGHCVVAEPLRLCVHFPSLNRYLLHNLLGQFALTGVMLAIIAAGLFSAVITANRNKRVDRIRRDLMNNLTHELKTPISTIGLAAEALNDPDMRKNEDTLRHYVGLIREENKRLAVLVENVLQASLADSGNMRLFMQSLNAHEVIKEVVKNLAIQTVKRGGKVELDLSAGNPVIEADRIHWTNVVYNLIDNALKYASEHPVIRITSRNTATGVEFRFKDNGIGIPKEHLGKVFDRLYRVPTGNVHDVKGFGLGLSYVRTVVVRHHGAIHVESEPGKGSTFVIELPKTQPVD